MGMANKVGVEPGPSEFSWGRGVQAPMSKGAEPSQYEQLRSIYATNPADPESVADPVEQGFIREG